MDPTQELIVKMIENLQGTMEVGFKGVHDRQDIANGRQNKTEANVEVLFDRTKTMACETHIEKLKAIEKRLEEGIPPRRVGRELAITGVSAATLVAIADVIWKWFH